MACSRCGSSAAPVHGRCGICGHVEGDSPIVTAVATPAPLGRPSDPGTEAGAESVAGPSAPTEPQAEAPTYFAKATPDSQTVAGPGVRYIGTSGSPLTAGQSFGTRYHIIRLLGKGGMGAVYQAWDTVLEVSVAVKVIRLPETTDAEETREMEKRFKRELLLARQVTHKNVVRIHDLGEIDGITYLTMPYVHGEDLATIVKRDGKLPIDRVLSIAKQVGSGLAAAHEAGVVHRDLKPANIMVEEEGNALIMDFGIARSTSAGMTMTAGGAVVGTIDYMAPEQARGEHVDQRADIYAFGLILIDLVLGRRRASHNTAVAALLDRMQKAPPPVRSIDPTIPVSVDALITKCLQPNPADRYSSFRELLLDLDHLDAFGNPLEGHTAPLTSPIGPPPLAPAQPVGWQRYGKWAIAAALLIAVAGVGWSFRDRMRSPSMPTESAVAGPPISLAVLPFRNASGDPTLDSLGPNLSQILATMLGQSSRVRTVPSDRMNQVLKDLRIASNATLNPSELSSVANLTNARRVLWGQYSRFGSAIRIDATLQDLDRIQSLPLNAMAPNETGLLVAISELANGVRKELARGSPDILKELTASSWKPSTTSFEALRLYNEGVRLTQQGTHQEALKSFEAATKLDSGFALAFSGLAQSYSTLGFDSEAAQASRLAMTLGEGLPAREKYLISANHYRIVNDTNRAIESYENLATASPTNASVQFDLGDLYEQSGQLDQAAQHYSKVVELDPKYLEGLLAMGRVEIRRGNPQGSLEHLNSALTLAIQLDNDEARGNVLQAMGIAYKRMDRADEALRNYQDSYEIRKRLGNKSGMAGSLNEIAQIQALMGKTSEAEQSFQTALKLRREIGDKSGTGTILLNLASFLNETLGRPDAALPLLKEALQIRRDSGNPAGIALVLNNIGSVYLSKGDFSEAQTYFERTLEIREKAKAPRELAETLHNLAETSWRMGRYDQSLSQYLRALEFRRTAGDKRGAAIESYSMGAVFDYQGRYGAAIKAKEEALQTFRELKQRDMWLGEILSGLGSSLSMGGRVEEASKNLDEAMALAKELQNAILTAQTMRIRADRLLYTGDAKSASELAEQSAQAAAKTADKGLTLQAQSGAAIATAAVAPGKAVAAKLETLSQQADTIGLKALAVEISIHRAAVLLALGDGNAARQEADRALAKAEPLGLRLSQARAHYLRAEVLRPGGGPDARREYSLALRLLNEIKGEEGNQNLLTRTDLAKVYAACEQGSKGA
jgi:serine/threonine protein kinase/Tfp pilus assembly protein PilF